MIRVRAGDYSISVESCAGTMDPSPYTQFIAENLVRAKPPKVAIDVGCGSGVLAILLAKMGAEKVYAVDINPAAVKATRINAYRNDVKEKLRFIQGDMIEFFNQKIGVDMIVSNPPSLPMPRRPRSERESYNYHGGDDGREFIQKLICDSSRVLTNHGKLVFINTSLANFGKTVEQLPRYGFESFKVECKKSPFRESYYEYFDWFNKLKEENVSDYISENNHHYEMLYAINAEYKICQ